MSKDLPLSMGPNIKLGTATFIICHVIAAEFSEFNSKFIHVKREKCVRN